MTTDTAQTPTQTQADHALTLLSKALFVQVTAVTQTGDDDDTAQIRLHVNLPDGRGHDVIRIGSIANWWNFPIVQRKIATRTGLVPPPQKPKAWMEILESIYATGALTREEDAELSVVGRLQAILPTYIHENGSRNRDEACAAGNPYIDDNDPPRVYVHADTLALWLGRARNWRIDAPDVRHALTDLHWTPSVALNYDVYNEAEGTKTRRKARYHEAPAAKWLDTEEADA